MNEIISVLLTMLLRHIIFSNAVFKWTHLEKNSIYKQERNTSTILIYKLNPNLFVRNDTRGVCCPVENWLYSPVAWV
jgi:hypothetical protein